MINLKRRLLELETRLNTNRVIDPYRDGLALSDEDFDKLAAKYFHHIDDTSEFAGMSFDELMARFSEELGVKVAKLTPTAI